MLGILLESGLRLGLVCWAIHLYRKMRKMKNIPQRGNFINSQQCNTPLYCPLKIVLAYISVHIITKFKFTKVLKVYLSSRYTKNRLHQLSLNLDHLLGTLKYYTIIHFTLFLSLLIHTLSNLVLSVKKMYVS